MLLATVAGQAGRIQTLDQRSLSGMLLATNGALLLVSTNPTPEVVSLTNLLAAWFDDEDLASAHAARGSGLGLLGYYFANTNLIGTAFVRLDETVDFDWNQNEPAPGLPRDLFSVVWSGEVEAPATGSFTFYVAADDRTQLYLTNRLLLSAAGPRAFSETPSLPVTLESGRRYAIRVIYADGGGPAGVHLLWSGPDLAKSVIPRQRLFPTGLDVEHPAQVNTPFGLLATYYLDAELRSRSSFTRVDPTIDFDWSDRDPAPGISRTNFSVRWTGRMRVDYTEEYTFYATTDEPVRFWIDNRLLVDRPEQAWLSESKESIPLVAGEQYEVRLETRSTGGSAVAKLHWSSGSIARTNVPSTHLSPSRPAVPGRGSLDAHDKTPPGVLLRNGSFIAGQVEHATATALRGRGLLQQHPVSAVNVARIICQPLSPALASRIGPGRTGVLLAKGDFVDGDFRGLESGRVSLSSILFGMRTFEIEKEVVAVALRDPYPPLATFQIRLRDQSLLLPHQVSVENSGLKVDDAILGALLLPWKDLHELRRRLPLPSTGRRPG
ncbi:MAG TPA: PA14 domain-containing protein [Verrucomicrobiae bacterium]|nr:PA14 domain-containing protein [Verrucomicrobiae bacterium]